MKSNNKIIYFWGFIIILGLNLYLPSVKGVLVEKTSSTIADMDTYVDTDNALSNYGGVNYLYSGFSYSGDFKESYFHFDISSKPENVTKAELSLDIFGVSQTMNLTVSIIEESWNELTMTWMNKPIHDVIIGNIVATSSDIYSIDITSLLASRSAISFCVNMTVDLIAVLDYVFITSREGYYLSSDAPQIIWTYLETEATPPPFNPFILIVVVIVVLGLGITIFLVLKRNKTQTKTRSLQTKTHDSPYAISMGSVPKICPECGSKIDGKFCQNCGKQLNL